MAYLGTYTITPNSVEIDVDCYGEIHPEPISAHTILERVKHNGHLITDYLSANDLDYLQNKINEK